MSSDKAVDKQVKPKRNLSLNQKIDLVFPVDDGGQEIKSMTMRRPRVRDMLISSDKDSSDAQNEVRLFAALCDLTPELLEGLDLVDYQALQVAYTGFLS